jgi:hypothetical protein
MWFGLYLGIGLLAMGFAALCRAVGLPGVLFLVPADASPMTIAGVCFPLGLFLVLICTQLIRAARRRWLAYAPVGEAFARTVAEGKVKRTGAPRRPGFVVGATEDCTTAKPLDPDTIAQTLDERLFTVLADLLEPCGEARTMLGTTTLHIPAPGVVSERLTPAWVVDREWADGRTTIEWVYVGAVGKRLRVAGGARVRGALLWRLGRFHLWLMLGSPFFAAMVGITGLGYIGFPGIVFFAIIAQISQKSRHTWLTLVEDTLSEPFAACRQAEKESDLVAAKDRVSDAVSELEPLRSL